MNSKEILFTAKKLHSRWMKENRDFVNACKKDPQQNNCSRDFTRALPWKDLPEFWKTYYQKEARIKLLTKI